MSFRKLVFVYGSLKEGFWNNHCLDGAMKLGSFNTVDNFTLTDCGFPYMVPDSDGAPVSGEVWEVGDRTIMARLDSLEGVSYGHYEHLEIEVEGLDETVTAYTPVNVENALSYRKCELNEEGLYEWGK